MDLKLEITNHLEWIDIVASLINEEELSTDDLKELTDFDHCALGEWMNSDDSKYLWKEQEFVQLTESHQRFHKLAGDLVSFIQQGEVEQALSTQAEFLHASEEVVEHLQMLDKVKEK